MTSSTSVYSSVASSPSKHITVIDVYDLAESINCDFEILAGLFGNDPFESVVKKVISALETLEALAKHNDTENYEILDLRKSIERFENERLQRIRDKENLEKDIIELEENYKKEIDELCKIVNKLQVENANIKEQISSKIDNINTNTELKEELSEEQLQTLIELRKMTHIQKEQIKDLQKDLNTYCNEVENLRDNIERLIQQNKELLRKNSSLQKQGRMILLERAELMRRLQQSEENAIQLRRVLNETNRACKDMELQKQFDEQSPRFTLGELREVLQEKNMLKAKVIELEEKIDQIRASSPAVSDNNDIIREGTSTENLSIVATSPATVASLPSVAIEATPKNTVLAKRNELRKNSEECLVFGPINREPDEKLQPWKYERKDSGIRRFFRILNSINTSLTPRSSGTPK